MYAHRSMPIHMHVDESHAYNHRNNIYMTFVERHRNAVFQKGVISQSDFLCCTLNSNWIDREYTGKKQSPCEGRHKKHLPKKQGKRKRARRARRRRQRLRIAKSNNLRLPVREEESVCVCQRGNWLECAAPEVWILIPRNRISKKAVHLMVNNLPIFSNCTRLACVCLFDVYKAACEGDSAKIRANSGSR